MAFCSACGQEIGDASFCPKCGASQGTATTPVPAVAAASPTAGLDENVAGLLCYILGWITGLIFLLIDKRPFVKFHAAQSIAMSIGVFVIYFVLGIFMGLLHFVHLGLLAFLLYPLLGLALFVLWIFVMYKAFQHEKFKLPIIGGSRGGNGQVGSHRVRDSLSKCQSHEAQAAHFVGRLCFFAGWFALDFCFRS
jgi:uncharacterized membrane protein